METPEVRDTARGRKLGELKRSTFAILADMLCTEMTLTQIAEKWRLKHQRISKIYRDARAAGLPIPDRIRGKLPK